MMASVAGKGLSVAENMAAQRVIGYSRTVTRTKGKKNPKVIQENLNVGVQAWEIAALLGGVAIYEYVNGPGSLLNNLIPSSAAAAPVSSSKLTFCQMFPTSVACL